MRGRRIPFVLRVPLIYALVGGFWILLSDRLVVFLFSTNPATLSTAQTVKGWFFIAITGLLLFFLLLHEARSKRKTEEQFTAFFQRAVEGVFRSTPDGRFTSINPAMAQMFGYSSPEEMLDLVKDIQSQIYFSPEARRQFTETVNQHGVIEKFESQVLRKDRSVFWISTNARIVRNDDGKVLYYEGLITDITKQKQAELALQQAEARYRALVEQMPAAVYTDSVSDESVNHYSSPQIQTITGYSPEEWLEEPGLWIRLIHPEDRPRVLEENERTNRTREPFDLEYRLIARNGHVVWIHDMATLICAEDGTPLHWQGLLIDITAQHEAEEAARASDARYHTLVEQASDAIFISNPEGKYVEVNQRACDMLGYSRSELLELHIQDLMRDEPPVPALLTNHKLTNGSTVVSEQTLLRKDRSIVPVELSARLLPGGMLMSIVRDISERKKAELSLQEAEKRYRVLVEKLPAVVFMDAYEDPQSTQYISPRIHDLLGYTTEEWIASDHLWEEALHPEDSERVLAEDLRTNEIGAPFRAEYRLRARDGHYVWIREEAYLVNGEDGKPRYWQGILLDITQQRQAQEALGRREAILEAVSFAAEQFLKSTNWEDCVLPVLARLGRTAQASRVYVFKKHLSNKGELLISQLFEWVNAGVEPQIDNPYLQNMDFAQAGYSRWIRLFDEGLPVYGTVKYLPESEQVEFRKEGILSIICLPIPVGNDWWGFIGFDDCESEREWATLEIETLRAAVSMLGAAIQRRLAEEAVFRGETSYQGLFNSVNDAIYIQDVEGRLLDVNEGAMRLHDHPKEFFVGSTLEIIGPNAKNQREQIHRSFELALQGEPQRFELFGLRGQGQVFPMEMQFYRGVYFGEEVVIAVAQDITERKRAEGALQRQLKELTVLHAVAMAESTAENQDALLQRVTDIIGDTLYTDNCGILLLDRAGTVLVPHASYRGTTLDNLRTGIPVTTGISGMVATTRRPIRTGNVREYPEYHEVTPDICSELCVPIISGEKVLGVLNVESRQPEAFTEADERLLSTIAGGVATALERLRFFELEQTRRKEAETLREATAALTATVELPEVFETILQTVSTLVPCVSASIELIDGDQVEIVAQKGLPYGNDILGTRFPHEPNKWGTDLWQPIILPDVQVEQRFRKLAGSEFIRSWMGVPLIAQDMLIGYLNLDSDKVAHFTEEHGALVQTFANQAAIAIENARTLHEERRRTRIIEALADIANESATTGEVDSLLEQVARRSLDLLNASHVAIYLLQDDNVTIQPVTAQGTFSHEILSHVLKLGEGITGHIIQTGRSEIINDTRSDPRRIRVPGTSDEDGLLETMMSSALILRGKPIGAINVWRLRSDGLFNASELNFLISIAHQTSISIDAGRLLQETVRRAQETEAIAEVGRDISATLQLDVVLERIGKYAKDLLGAETSAVYLYEPEESLRAIAAFGLDAQELKGFWLKLGKGIVGNIAVNKVGEIVNNTAADPRGVTVEGTVTVPDEHLMAVPVLSKGELTGLLAVWRSGVNKDFVPHELEFLASLAQQAAVAIENARLFQAEQRRRQEAENLRIAATAITSTLEPGQVLETILVALQQVVRYDSSAIFQLEGEHVRITAAKGFPNNETTIGLIFPANNQLFVQIRHAGQALILADVRQSPYFERWAGADTIRGWMGVPLTARGEIIGFITMDSYAVGAFTEKDALLAQTFAHQAAAAIENARLFNETRQRVEELEVVSRVSVALRVAQDSQKILLVLLDEIKRCMDTDTAGIWLYDRDRGEVVQKACSGGLAQLPKPDCEPGEGIVGYVFQTANIHISPEFAKDPKVSHDILTVLGEDWGGIAVPIRTTSETIGVLMVAIPTTRRIQQHHLRLLETIAEIAGNAINRSNLYEKSEEQVRRLTTLRELDTAISSSFDLRVTLDILTEHLLSKMGASATATLILNPESQALTLYSAAGFRDPELLRINAQNSNSLAMQVLLSQKDVFIENLETHRQATNSNWIAREGFVSYYGVTLQSKGLIRGVLETYFRQPFVPNTDWRDFLRTLAGQATIAVDNTRLFENLQRSNQELSLAYDTTLEGWSKALELRDKETQGHSRRVTDLTLELARRMGIPEAQLTHIRRGVLVHDIGKMGVPDNILRKEGPLTDEEWIEMRKHPQYAFDLLYPIQYLRPALDIAYCHHEWWDGSGYPSGLKGNKIPLAARIFAVVDVWDALLSNRPYRSSWNRQKVIQHIRGLSGKQFDPEVVDAFLSMMSEKPAKAARKRTSSHKNKKR